MQLTPLTNLILILVFLPQFVFSTNDVNQINLKNKQPLYNANKIFKQTILETEVMNIDHELTSENPLIIDFNTPHGLIIFKDSNNITIDIDIISNTYSTGNENQKINNKPITKDTTAFFFGNSLGKIHVRTTLPNTHFTAVKIIFPETCQQFYLQTKYDDFQVIKNSGKAELISSFSLTEENSFTCYYLDMDFVPYFVSFDFNDENEFVKINGKITNSEFNQIIFTEKSILTFENIYFSQKSSDKSRQLKNPIPKPQINMTIFSHISNSDDLAISNIMNQIVYFKGYLQNTPGFIKGYTNEINTTHEYSNNLVSKKKQTTIIIVTVLCVIVVLIICSAISYCIKKRKYCKFYNIADNDDAIIPRDHEIPENDQSSSMGADIDHTHDNLSNDEFEDREYLQNEFDERYPQNNFQQSNIEYRVPSQTLLATVLDEANAKL